MQQELRAYINQTKVLHITNEGTASSRECESEAPESPLECAHGHDGHGLENHGQRRLSARHATVQETDTGDDQEHKTAHDHLVDIFPLEADVGRVDVHLLRVAAIGNALVEAWLCPRSVRGSDLGREGMNHPRTTTGAVAMAAKSSCRVFGPGHGNGRREGSERESSVGPARTSTVYIPSITPVMIAKPRDENSFPEPVPTLDPTILEVAVHPWQCFEVAGRMLLWIQKQRHNTGGGRLGPLPRRGRDTRVDNRGPEARFDR